MILSDGLIDEMESLLEYILHDVCIVHYFFVDQASVVTFLTNGPSSSVYIKKYTLDYYVIVCFCLLRLFVSYVVAVTV